MSRRRAAVKREIIPDAKYGDVIVAKAINYTMLDGKKSVAEKIIYGAFDIIEAKSKKPGVDVFKEAVDNLKPDIEVRSRRVGGATYQVPVEVGERRALALALRWLVKYSRARKEGTMQERMAGELLDAVNEAGASYKKKIDVHKMAESNKAFAHFRW